jgi:hypothetical protein
MCLVADTRQCDRAYSRMAYFFSAQQVIRQTWITSHFWVLSKRPRSADERFLFITAMFTPPRLGCKARFSEVFQLAAVQTPVLSLPISAPGWAVSAKHVAMQQVARETWAAFERRLERAQVPAPQRPDYHKWTRFYLDFCHKYGHPPRSPTSLGPFLNKLAAKKQSAEQRHQAAQAIRLLLCRPAKSSAGVPVENAALREDQQHPAVRGPAAAGRTPGPRRGRAPTPSATW